MNSPLPNTIIFPEAFQKSLPPGFDGIFDWGFLRGVFGKTITPMDFDGVVERHGHYLVFETKDEGKEIPQGQLLTLNNLIQALSFTVIKIWGKREIGFFEIMFPNGRRRRGCGQEELVDLCDRWFSFANQNSESWIRKH